MKNAAENTNQGLVELTTDQSVDIVYNKLLAVIQANPNLSVIAELDHQANAARVNLELPPTKLVLFGNPNLGTPLMLNQRSVALDLPQKMLVYEATDGTTKLLYNDPAYLARRHGLAAELKQLDIITGALGKLATAAIAG